MRLVFSGLRAYLKLCFDQIERYDEKHYFSATMPFANRNDLLPPRRRMKQNWSIRAHLYLLVLAVAAPLVAFLIFILYQDADENARQTKTSSLNLAQITASDTEHFLKDIAALVEHIAQRPLVRAVDPQRCDPILEDLHALYPKLANIGVIDTRGRIICSAVPPKGGKPVIVAGTEWFQRTLSENRPILGQPFLGPITGKWVSVQTYPLHDGNGKITGLLALPIDLVNFTPIARNATLPEGSMIGIMNSSGVVIARSIEPEKWVGKNIRNTPIVEIVLAQKEGQAVSTGVDGVTRMYGFTPIPGTDWSAVAGIPRESILQEIRSYALRNGLIGLVIVLTILGLAFYFSRKIERPIRAIADAALAVSQGNLQTRATTDGPKEISEVASQFNTMLDVRKDAEDRLSYLAQYDVLTRLPNRILFRERLEQAIGRAQRNNTLVALMFLDLDRFKEVNDTLGHPIGDRVLQRVSERLTKHLRHVDTIARLGGDEFTIVLENIHNVDEIIATANKIQEALSNPLIIEGREIFVTASIGISVYPFDMEDIDELLKNADIAMYQAKQEGRNTHQFFASEMNTKTTARLKLESHLRHAVARNEFSLAYQPQVDIKSGRIIGAEALIRWNDHELGPITPAQFIPLAEETGLIVPMGEWVLRTACAQNKAWQSTGCTPIPMAVNLSARQFRQANLLEMIALTLHEADLDPHYLELEITESVIMHHSERTIQTLQKLHAMGVKLSIDDFGTGYSSLSYLKRFPVHKLKIDQSFVHDIGNNPDDAAIVTAVIAMARGLKLITIAEGVETPEQLAFLQGLNCQEYQGYYFGKPMSADAFLELLRQQPPLP